MVLARGRFDEVKIEALMREHGARVETYNGKRLVVADHRTSSPHRTADTIRTRPTRTPRRETPPTALRCRSWSPASSPSAAPPLIRSAIDLHHAGNNPQKGLESVTGNEELMNLVRSIDDGNAWAVGRFDALGSHARLPEAVSSQIPAITWVSVSGHVNGGIRGVVRAEARDDEAANNLRDVVRGFLALAKLQTGAKPELQLMMQSLELSGTGKTVALSFAVPAEVFDLVGAVADKALKPEAQ